MHRSHVISARLAARELPVQTSNAMVAGAHVSGSSTAKITATVVTASCGIVGGYLIFKGAVMGGAMLMLAGLLGGYFIAPRDT